MSSPRPAYTEILRTLLEYQVECIVIGGVCGALHGAALITFDLDVVHRRTPENLARLLAALRDLDAVYRELARRRIVPTESHLASPGHQLLVTRFGNLDLLGTLG